MRWLAVLLSLLFFASPIKADEVVVGRWCQTLVEAPAVIKRDFAIIIDAKGNAVARSRYSDGSTGDQALIEQSGGIYLVKDSPAKDKYRIVKSSGELQIIDQDGLVDVASMVPIGAPQNACLN